MNKKANKLIDETSTYLLQHAHNPVEWYPWSQEALDASRAQEKPILLSIGYSACHWCHVMEHESFEDEETAALMNKLFINIKVDREERQDLDEIYMRAVQVMTGHGGWPMTVFLTPDLKPFFAGTYFPPENKHGMPSFKRVMLGVAQAWQDQRADILESASEITQHIAQLNSISSQNTDQNEDQKINFDKSIFTKVLQKISSNFDPKWGGFGGAPKFPHPSTLQLLLRIREMLQGEEQKQANRVIETTLDKMALGGIWDHLSGGFARYSTDRRWLVPHFEKMLYDNALLAPVYFNAYLATGKTFYKEVGCSILSFVENELTSEDGVFYSSLDADSEGEEGKFYVFSLAELKEVLGEVESKWFATTYGATEEGNFEHHTNVLHLQDILSEDDMERARTSIQKLLKERSLRVRPGRDDKILTSWSALMITALVSGYRATREIVYLERAKRAASFLLEKMEKDGNLSRTYGRGKARLNGYLDDYAYFAQALLDLSACDANPMWYQKALLLTNKSIEYFYSQDDKDFYYTPTFHESLIIRPKNYFDGAVPSGTSVALLNLLRLYKLSDNEQFSSIAIDVMGTYSKLFERAPDQFAIMLCALDMHLSQGKEIVFVLDSNDASRIKFLEVALSRFAPNDLELTKMADTEHSSPMFEGRGLHKGKSTAYICQNYACQEPITDIDQLSCQLHPLLVKSSQKETKN
ncbi:MAG: thioredoxin domain-containing protein [Candidatus Melainabacteria bacterium]|nr:MAG: thioredoxin domain-containing protein [Candidatus Melainabacteria bacterium]